MSDKAAAIRALSAPDAIMEPNVMYKLKGFIGSGGVPKQAIKLLSDGYEGKASMCNLLLNWLDMTEEEEAKEMSAISDEDSSSNGITEALHTIVIDRFQPERADLILKSREPPWLREIVKDESWEHPLQKLAVKPFLQFFKNKYDFIFMFFFLFFL